MPAGLSVAKAGRFPQVESRAAAWLAGLVIIAAISFNFVLCFVNTNVTAINASTVMACEALVISGAFIASARSFTEVRLIAPAITIAYVLLLALARAVFSLDAGIDIKIARDLLIPFAFFLLGCGIKDLKHADLIVKVCALCVVGVGLVEYFFLDEFLRYFNVIMYYVVRGTVDMRQLEVLSTNLFVSGLRPEGRSMLPFLGDHRVSSIFLEPVSPGNFAVIIFSWALVRAQFDGRFQWSVFAAAVVIVIMADNRFGAYLCALSILFVLLPQRLGYLIVACLPAVLVVGLVGLAATLPGGSVDDSLIGRMLSAGRVLAAFKPADWFGLGKGATDAFNSGYAYTISQIGIPAAAGVWLLFLGLNAPSWSFQGFRTLAGLYLGTILAVSYSPYTIKTASILWFLLGALFSAEKSNSSEALS